MNGAHWLSAANPSPPTSPPVLPPPAQLAAATTVVGVSLQHKTFSYPDWVDRVLLAGGAVSAACALATLGVRRAAAACKWQSEERSAAPLRTATVLCGVGLAAHATMLACLTVYWRFLSFRTYLAHGPSGRGMPTSKPINYFDYFISWSGQERALYFGCVAGVAAWAAALAAAACDAWLACQQLAASIPLTAALLCSTDGMLPSATLHRDGSGSSLSSYGCSSSSSDGDVESPHVADSPCNRRSSAGSWQRGSAQAPHVLPHMPTLVSS